MVHAPPALSAWIRDLARPDGASSARDDAASVGRALDALPLRSVYATPPDLDDADRRLQGAEWSLRFVAPSRIDRARVMVAVDPQRTPAGSIGAALTAIHGSAARLAAPLAERIRRRRPDLDVLLGADFTTPSRAKLYVVSPSGRPTPADFDDLAVQALRLHGVHAAWSRRTLDRAQRHAACFAMDLDGAEEASGKLYFYASSEQDAAWLLRRLDAPHLEARIDEANEHRRGAGVGAWVVSLRARADRTADVSLHARIDEIASLPAPLDAAWHALDARAQAYLHRALRPTYLSWTAPSTAPDSPHLSLYYRARFAGELDGGTPPPRPPP